MIGQALEVQQLVEGERQRLLAENQSLRRELKQRYDFSNIIGNSGPMRQVFELETELFGHERGRVHRRALPQEGPLRARRRRHAVPRRGRRAVARDAGEAPPRAAEREFERLGGTETLKANVRVIAATNRPLEKAIAESAFREDLYYRLNVFTIFIPPLRERKPDVLLLANHFLAKCTREHKKKIKRISTPAIDMLMAYHWPGNVRELENAIERAVVVCDGNVLHAHHLPPTLQTAEASGTTPTGSLDEQIATFERSVISDALKATRGNKAKAARLLGTTERIVSYKMRKYAIDPARFRAVAEKAAG